MTAALSALVLIAAAVRSPTDMLGGGPSLGISQTRSRSFAAIAAEVPWTRIDGPLRVSRVNPRYFTNDTGRAIYLTGSHTWPNFQDGGLTDPPKHFTWSAYLDMLQAHHLNV